MKGKILFISVISCFLLTGFSTTVKADETDQSRASQTNTPAKNNSGWKVTNGNTYYLKNGAAIKGLKKINGYWYLFNKNGAMLKNVRKVPHTKHYSYFDQLGRRRMKNTAAKKAYYWINKKGIIYSLGKERGTKSAAGKIIKIL